MTYAVLLWDFGDTLVDERWMRRAPAGVPAWEAAWTSVMDDLADDWNVGAVDSATVRGAGGADGDGVRGSRGPCGLLPAAHLPLGGMGRRVRARGRRPWSR